jgi:hypothetical protein
LSFPPCCLVYCLFSWLLAVPTVLSMLSCLCRSFLGVLYRLYCPYVIVNIFLSCSFFRLSCLSCHFLVLLSFLFFPCYLVTAVWSMGIVLILPSSSASSVNFAMFLLSFFATVPSSASSIQPCPCGLVSDGLKIFTFLCYLLLTDCPCV